MTPGPVARAPTARMNSSSFARSTRLLIALLPDRVELVTLSVVEEDGVGGAGAGGFEDLGFGGAFGVDDAGGGGVVELEDCGGYVDAEGGAYAEVAVDGDAGDASGHCQRSSRRAR